MKNMQKAQQRWATNTATAASNGTYAEAVQSVTESPGVAANRNIQGYVNGVQKAMAEGRVESGNLSYSAEEWKQQTISKGAPALAAAVSKVSERKKRNQVQAMTDSATLGAAIKQSMPGSTDAERDARMLAYVQQRRQMRVNGRR